MNDRSTPAAKVEITVPTIKTRGRFFIDTYPSAVSGEHPFVAFDVTVCGAETKAPVAGRVVAVKFIVDGEEGSSQLVGSPKVTNSAGKASFRSPVSLDKLFRTSLAIECDGTTIARGLLPPSTGAEPPVPANEENPDGVVVDEVVHTASGLLDISSEVRVPTIPLPALPPPPTPLHETDIEPLEESAADGDNAPEQDEPTPPMGEQSEEVERKKMEHAIGDLVFLKMQLDETIIRLLEVLRHADHDFQKHDADVALDKQERMAIKAHMETLFASADTKIATLIEAADATANELEKDARTFFEELKTDLITAQGEILTTMTATGRSEVAKVEAIVEQSKAALESIVANLRAKLPAELEEKMRQHLAALEKAGEAQISALQSAASDEKTGLAHAGDEQLERITASGSDQLRLLDEAARTAIGRSEGLVRRGDEQLSAIAKTGESWRSEVEVAGRTSAEEIARTAEERKQQLAADSDRIVAQMKRQIEAAGDEQLVRLGAKQKPRDPQETIRTTILTFLIAAGAFTAFSMLAEIFSRLQ